MGRGTYLGTLGGVTEGGEGVGGAVVVEADGEMNLVKGRQVGVNGPVDVVGERLEVENRKGRSDGRRHVSLVPSVCFVVTLGQRGAVLGAMRRDGGRREGARGASP